MELKYSYSHYVWWIGDHKWDHTGWSPVTVMSVYENIRRTKKD